MALGKSSWFTAQHGRIWVSGGPGDTPTLLMCHGSGDVAIPAGDITPQYCPSPTSRGAFDIAVRTQAPAGSPTWSVEAPVGKTADFIERYSRCPLTFWIVQSECGDPRLFSDYERVQILENGIRTNTGISNLASRDGDDLALMSFDFEFDKVDAIYPLAMARQTTAETEDMLDIAFGNSFRCQGACGAALEECVVGVAVAGGAVGAPPNGYYTLNGGATWTVWPALPYAVNAEDISSVVMFPMGPGVYRILCARGTADAGAADVAYSDDYGTTWTVVDLPTANGDFVPWNGGLFALSRYDIWAITDDSLVVKSEDGGLTWAAQTTASAASLNAIKFLDENYGLYCGEAGEIYSTSNGGDSWALVDPPAAQAAGEALACDLTDSNTFYTGWADGEIWFTSDGGANWVQQNITAPGTVNQVNDIKMVDAFVGFGAIKYTVGADIYGGLIRTFDGGNSWETYATEVLDVGTNGMSAVWPCTVNKAFGVGDVETTATIYVASD